MQVPGPIPETILIITTRVGLIVLLTLLTTVSVFSGIRRGKFKLLDYSFGIRGHLL